MMMKRILNNLLIAGMVVLSSWAYAAPGLLFNIAQSGSPAALDIILCLNGKGPLSCQHYHVAAQNLQISTTVNHSYPTAGIKVLTPGYQASGCTPSPNGYCLFAVSTQTATPIILNQSTPPTTTYTIGGLTHGLLGTLVLENNGSNALTMTADGTFTFPKALSTGSAYSVTVQSQPETQTCTVSNGSGTVGTTNINSVQVTCATKAYSLGGTVSGLSGTVVLQNNGADNLSLSASGPFTFSTPVAEGASYAVTVFSSPVGQTCSITANGSGTMPGANVNNVVVNCASVARLTSSATNNSLTLSATGRTEYGITGTPSSGVPRVIQITNVGDLEATGLSVSFSGLPSDTTLTGSTCDGQTTLAPHTSCTMMINPGSFATSDSSGTSCSTSRTQPVPGTIQVSSTNAGTISTSVVVLDYACIYQGGYMFAFDDTQGCLAGTCTGSVGGKVVTTSDLATAYPDGIVWSSQGTTGGGNADVTYDIIPLIGDDVVGPTPTYAIALTQYNTTYSSYAITYPFPPSSSFATCNGTLDGACNSANIKALYGIYTTSSVTQTVSPGATPNNSYATGLCFALTTYANDWYLPAICEMGYRGTGQNAGCGATTTPTLQNIQFSLIDLMGFTVPQAPQGYYWSSTELSGFSPTSLPSIPQQNAWQESFDTSVDQISGTNIAIKNALMGVRCVRGLTY